MESSRQRVSPRRLALGIVLGLGLGLFIDAVLVVLLRAPLLYFIVFTLGLIVILPIVAGIRIGLRFVRRRLQRELSWPALLLLAAILWPTAIALPFGVCILQLRLTAQAAVPIYPGARPDRTAVELGDNENSSDRVRLTFFAEADSSDILKFYRNELARRGWEEGPQHFIERKMDSTPYWFRHKSKFQHIHIKFGRLNQDGKLLFEVIYGL